MGREGMGAKYNGSLYGQGFGRGMIWACAGYERDRGL